MNTKETAPKDGEVFLADLGWPSLVVCSWNGASECWVWSRPSVDLYKGEWNDCYFENEYEKEKELLGWIPIPRP